MKSEKRSRKADIIAAAESLLRESGLAGVTTRAVAERVPCSEGAIYVHFGDKLDLLLAVLESSLPEMLVPLHALAGRVGTGTPRQNLVSALNGLLKFHERVTPMLCSLLADQQLLERFRASLEAGGKGPQAGIATIAAYIGSEQSLGRIPVSVDAKTAALCLMSCSFFHVFTARLFGASRKLDVAKIVDTVLG